MKYILPQAGKPIKSPATPEYDFVEDDSASFPSFLRRDMIDSIDFVTDEDVVNAWKI